MAKKKAEKIEDQVGESTEKVLTPKIKLVRFTLKNRMIREFCPEFHGKDFVKVADTFGETKEMFIEKREDL